LRKSCVSGNGPVISEIFSVRNQRKNLRERPLITNYMGEKLLCSWFFLEKLNKLILMELG